MVVLNVLVLVTVFAVYSTGGALYGRWLKRNLLREYESLKTGRYLLVDTVVHVSCVAWPIVWPFAAWLGRRSSWLRRFLAGS